MSAVAHNFPARSFASPLVAQALDEALACGTATPVLAISGLQGSGKSTLAAQVVELARARGLRAATLSIDDTYLTRAQRQRLADQVHPLLATRGPPGTHDLPLALSTLQAARNGQPFPLPRFDKLADERVDAAHWQHIEGRLDLDGLRGLVPGHPCRAGGRAVDATERTGARGRWRRSLAPLVQPRIGQRLSRAVELL